MTETTTTATPKRAQRRATLDQNNPAPGMPEIPAPGTEPAAANQTDAGPGEGDRGPNLKPKRVPFGQVQPRLAAEARPGFQRRWINNDPGRIDRAIAGGWEHVKDAEGKPVSNIVGSAKTGGGLTSFLMEIPEEFYVEDQAAKQAQIDEFDRAIRVGAAGGHEPGHDGRYVPVGPDGKPLIKVTSGKR